MIDTGCEQHGDPLLGTATDVDLVDADSVFTHYLKPRQRPFDHAPGDQIVAAEVAVNAADESQRLGFGEWAAGGDDLPAGFRQQRMVRPWGVLEGGGRDQNPWCHLKGPSEVPDVSSPTRLPRRRHDEERERKNL